MRVGVLGAGFMGGTHARAFAKQPDVQIVLVSSRSLDKAQALAKEVGAAATTDDMEIVNDPSIDAVSITLPTHLHVEFAIAALRAGKHVLLEKPFGLNDSDCDRMIAAEATAGKHLMVAHVLRFWPEYEVLVEMARGGKLGEPLAAVATRLSVLPAWAGWFADPAMSGGAVLDLMVHDFDALNWVLGTPTSVYAQGHQAAPGLWNHIHGVVNYGAAHAFAEGSEMMPKDYPFSCGLRVLCTRGALEFSFTAGGTSVEMGGRSQLAVYEPGRAYLADVASADPYERQVEYFIGTIRENRPPTKSGTAGARLAVKVANAARRSLETGEVVTV
jgi:UDP-N-acetylglucosamine 3-dehydrogenase